MTLGLLLLVVLGLIFIGAMPHWAHSRGWGYGPSGGAGVLMLIVIALLMFGRL